MKNLVSIILTLFWITKIYSQNPTFQWVKKVENMATAEDVAQDADLPKKMNIIKLEKTVIY